MNTFLKSVIALSFWFAALLYWVLAYDMSIYTFKVINKTLSPSEILLASIYFSIGLFLIYFSFFQFKKLSRLLSTLALLFSAFIFISVFGLFDLIDKMEGGQNYKFSGYMLGVFLIPLILTTISAIYAWKQEKN